MNNIEIERVGSYELRTMTHAAGHKSIVLYSKGAGILYGPPHNLSLSQITAENSHLICDWTRESAIAYALGGTQ